MSQPVKLDDHSVLDPPLPIPNRTVKRLRANDSAATSVKVGYRQAVIPKNPANRLAGFLNNLMQIFAAKYIVICVFAKYAD